jgi:hypothetical protein
MFVIKTRVSLICQEQMHDNFRTLQTEPSVKRITARKDSCNLTFQASAAKDIRTALFWAVTQRVVVIPCRLFGTSYRFFFKDQESMTLERRDRWVVPKCR